MTMKLKYLPLYILLVGLAACSSKDKHENNQAVESQTQEDTVSLDAINEKSAVIVAKDKLSPDQSWQQAESKVLFPDPKIFYPKQRESLDFSETPNVVNDFSFLKDYERVKSLLNLNRDQIFVIGDKDRDTEENNVLLDLSTDEYFKYANNLAINYVRYLKSPNIQPKQEFEKTQDYDNRVKLAQQDAENNAIDYDVELLQKALNRSVEDISLALSNRAYHYDPDTEQLSLDLEQENKSGSSVVVSKILFKVQPELAKLIVENLTLLKMGYVFNFQDNKLNFEGVFFYFNQISKANRSGDPVEMRANITPVFKPLEFKQKSVMHALPASPEITEKLETTPFKDVLQSPLWNFKFGLENYLSPEDLIKKYQKQREQEQVVSEPEQESSAL
ncbi:hypothetical protein F3J02_11035 [Acinetobacter sp. Tr-809]|uniref:hypothetical protein n=1 Tax=Acinetobacter sp. Tr-809 TaxID=2608324 RepID=UPI00141DACA8|nr:hypothetical protein [Acinetobacter sp. Tr-809]NIE97002.1 hypothetical protein [Acinetobacter sp. Tr-809]